MKRSKGMFCPRRTLTAVAVASAVWMLAVDARSQSIYVNTHSTGPAASAVGSDSVAMGSAAEAHRVGDVAIGQNAVAGQPSGDSNDWGRNVALGSGARAIPYGLPKGESGDAVAIGTNAVAQSPNGIAIGKDSRTYIDDGVAIGNGATGSAFGVGIGTGATALAGDVAIGYRARAIASRNPYLSVTRGNIAIGSAEMTGADADQTGPVATEGYAIAIGTATQANGVAGIAMGQKAVASNDRATAIGMNAHAVNADDVALGANSVTDAPHATETVSIGDTSYAVAGTKPASVVSVGAPDSERQITNVAAGQIDSISTDAVNGSQLYATNQAVSANATSVKALSDGIDAGTLGVVRYVKGATPDADVLTVGASMGGKAVDVAGTSGARRLKGVADGVDASDAATVGQMAAVGAVIGQAVQYDDAKHARVTLGGADAAAPVGLSNVASGTVSATSTDAVNGAQLYATNQAVSANTTSVKALSDGIDAGTLGVVRYAKGATPDADVLTVGASMGGKAVDVAGTSGARRLKGVADGVDASDAATVGQMAAVGAVIGQAVQYDDAKHARVTLGGADAAAPVGLSNVASGTVSATSTEAVNGAQLYATNRAVSANATSVKALSDGIDAGTLGVVRYAKGATPDADVLTVGASMGGKAVDVAGTSGARRLRGVADGVDASDAATVGQMAAVGAVMGQAVQYDDAKHARVTLGGADAAAPVGLSNVASGTVSATSTDAVNGAQLYATNQAVSANTTSVKALSDGIDAGTLGVVRYAKGATPDADVLTVGASMGGKAVDVAGTSGARRLKGVADGVDASDAATVGQLGKVSTALGTLANNAIQYDNVGRSSVTLGGLGAATPVRLGNVAPGALSATSTEAVNGAQLFEISQTVAAHGQALDALSTRVNHVPAGIVNVLPPVALPPDLRYVSVRSDRAPAKAEGLEAVAMGGQALARGADSVAVGSGAQATGEGATALGAQTSAQGKGSVAIGRGSAAPDDNTVSIGNRETDLTRTLTNVSAGVGPTDAVNVRQLNEAVGGLRSQIEHDRRDASGGTASAVAIASLPQAPAPGQRIVSIGGGTYGGQSAMAVGVSTYAGRWIVKAAGSTNTRGTVAASVGAGYVW